MLRDNIPQRHMDRQWRWNVITGSRYKGSKQSWYVGKSALEMIADSHKLYTKYPTPGTCTCTYIHFHQNGWHVYYRGGMLVVKFHRLVRQVHALEQCFQTGACTPYHIIRLRHNASQDVHYKSPSIVSCTKATTMEPAWLAHNVHVFATTAPIRHHRVGQYRQQNAVEWDNCLLCLSLLPRAALTPRPGLWLQIPNTFTHKHKQRQYLQRAHCMISLTLGPFQS